jgi:hypothetical protein
MRGDGRFVPQTRVRVYWPRHVSPDVAVLKRRLDGPQIVFKFGRISYHPCLAAARGRAIVSRLVWMSFLPRTTTICGLMILGLSLRLMIIGLWLMLLGLSLRLMILSLCPGLIILSRIVELNGRGLTLHAPIAAVP